MIHTEKNVFKNVFYIVLDVTGKTKDNEKARSDLQALEIKATFVVESRQDKNESVLHSYEKNNLRISVCGSALKMPYGYAAYIFHCTKFEFKMNGFKSHDYHVFMHNLFLIAFLDMLPRKFLSH